MMDMESLEQLTLAMERSKVDITRPLSLTIRNKDEHHFTSFDDQEGIYMLDEELVWPCEVAEILDEHRIDAYTKFD